MRASAVFRPSFSLATVASVAVVLSITATRADAQPLVRQAGIVPGDNVLHGTANAQSSPALCRGDQHTLVVWSDRRAANADTLQSDGDIYAIRLDANGQPLDAAPFVVYDGAGEQRNPKVAWNGSAWLVAFDSYDPDPTNGYFIQNSRAVRVTAAGQSLDAAGILLFNGVQYFNIAGGNGAWLVMTDQLRPEFYGYNTVARRLANDGTFIDATWRTIMEWTYGPASAIYQNGEYLVVATEFRDTPATYKAGRVSASLSPLAATFVTRSPNIGANGSQFFVVWSDFVSLRASVMSNAGTLTTPAGIALSTLSPSGGDVSISHDGTNWFVAWQPGVANIRTARVSPSNVNLDPEGVEFTAATIQTMTTPRATALPAGGAALVWGDTTPLDGSDVKIARFSSSNAVVSSSVLSTSPAMHRTPDMARAGQLIAIASLSDRSDAAGDDRIIVTRLQSDGDILDAEPIVVTTGLNLGRPGIAWNGEVFMITWATGNVVYARRMTPEGDFVDASPISVMPGFEPAIAAVGDDFGIAAQRFGLTPQFIDSYFKRVDGPTGAVLDATSKVVATGYVQNVRVRSDSAQWMIVGQSNWSHINPQASLWLTRFNAAGELIATTEVPGGASGGSPDIAFSDPQTGKYLYTWRNNSLASADNSIAARMLNADFTFAGPAFTVVNAPRRQLRPTVAWMNGAFLLAWEDQRNHPNYDERTDIYAARVSPAGAVLDPNGFELLRTEGGDNWQQCVSLGSGVMFATQSMIQAPGVDTYRTRITLVGNVGCDSIDFNANNVYPEDFDVIDFMNVLAGATCQQCNDIDFNNNDVYPEDADVIAFFRVLAGGQCD